MMRIIEIRKMRKAPLTANRPKVPPPAALPEAHRARVDPEGRNPERSRGSRRLAFLYERPGKVLKELEAESLKKKLEELTKTPKGNRKVDRQLFDKDGNEIVTPKSVKSSGKSVSGTSSSRKRKIEDDSDSSHGTPTKAAESESEGENQYDFLETSTIKAELGRENFMKFNEEFL